jgi:DNA mismatch repair ATPase MutL
MVGTSIRVEQLYQSMPHRRRFWRQPHTERQHIVDTCTQYALIYPHIRMTVTFEQQGLLATTGSGDHMQTLHEVWPHINMYTVNAHSTGGSGEVMGYVGDHAIPTRRCQVVAINQRPVAVRGFIAHIIDEVLPPFQGQHTATLLQFRLPKDSIDINQRNQKDELGIRTPSVIARLLYDAIRQPSIQHVPPIHVSQQLPQATYIGRHAEWLLWSSSEGVIVMDPANVIHMCGITTFASGQLCVPPYPLDHATAQLFLQYADQWQQLGLQFIHNQDNQLCITRIPHMAHTHALDTAIRSCVRTIRRGGTLAMGLGHLLDPDWLYTQLTRHPTPWDGQALLMIGHQRIAHALRMPSAMTAVLDQAQLPQVRATPQ